MAKICRICFRETLTNFTEIVNDAASVQIKHEILLCIPEVDLNILRNPIVCTTCLNSLNTFYKFKKYCLHIEERVRSYMYSATNPTEVTIFDVQKSNSFTDLALNAKDVVVGPERCYIDDLNDLLDEALQTKEPEPSASIVLDDDDVELVVVKEEEEIVVIEDTLDSKLVYDTGVNNIPENEAIENPDSANVLKCELCKYQTNIQLSLMKHYTKHDKEQLYSCRLCSFSTANKGSLTTHTKRHTTDTVLYCHKCSFKALGVQVLQRHCLALHSSNTKVEQPVKSKKNQYKCCLCKFHSRKEDDLSEHLQDEHNKKLHLCPICNKATTASLELRKHMVAYHVTLPQDGPTLKGFNYKCKICNYTTSEKIDYSRHKRLHKPPEQCTMCDFSAVGKPLLNEHYRTVHRIKPRNFACDRCHFSATSNAGLSNHIRLKHRVAVIAY